MRVEIWTDIICPWCGLGIARLEKALAQFAHRAEVELVRRSFQLDESFPVDRTESVREMLSTKKGMSDAQVDQITSHVATLAEAEGLVPYVVAANRVGNTSLAHELAAWATDQGKGAEIWGALYKAYFGEARSVFDMNSLTAIAGEHGLDPQAAREALASGKYKSRVRADGRAARDIGVGGVPFVLLDGRYGVSGAQSVEAFAEALELAWSKRVER